MLLNKFNVNQIHIVGAPVAQNVYNQFDEFGLLVGLPRFSGEKIETYKRRLLDTYVNRANATYFGLINGITRELGLSLYHPIRIYPLKSGVSFIAENPIVIFNGPFVELWRDHENGILEMEIDRFDPNGDAYLIGELVNFINTRSRYFNATLINNTYERSMCILNEDNISSVHSEQVPPTERFTLIFPNINGGSIIPSTVFFSDSTAFARLVSSPAVVLNEGDYFLNTYTGDVTVFLTPTLGTTVRYDWIDYGFEPVASPVIIHDIVSRNFRRKLFQQILGDDGVYRDAMPTEFGADIINELLSVFALHWEN